MKKNQQKDLIRMTQIRRRSRIFGFIMALCRLSLFFTVVPFVGAATVDYFFASPSQSSDLQLEYQEISAADFPKIVSLVKVTNQAGFVVGQLDTSHFRVFEDSTREFPIEVAELTELEDSINVVLTIDRSGSMRGSPLTDEIEAAKSFVELMNEYDRSAIVSFSHEIRTDHPFSGDKNSLITAMNSLEATGGTAIFDALIQSASLINETHKKRAIILMTDGGDKDSQYNFDEALAVLTGKKIRVFTVGMGLKIDSPEEKTLEAIAEASGGTYYYSPSSKELEEIYRAISTLLHHQYRISYTTHNPNKDGLRRYVEIAMNMNTNTSSDTASYIAPYDPTPAPPDPPEPEPNDPPRPPKQPSHPQDPPQPPPVPPDDPPTTPVPPDDPQAPPPVPPDDPPLPPVDPPAEPPEPPKDAPLEVLPNPFTPNDDGFNDQIEFKKGKEFPADWIVTIMDRAGRLVRRLANGEHFWDGRNENGELMLPGGYLYLITHNHVAVQRGLVYLIR